MAFVEVAGKKIYYEEYGEADKPTVLYIHGGPGESCLTYSYQAKEFGKYFHMISFDQYGVFRSDPVSEEENADVHFHVDLIEQMRIRLGIDKWIPLGHSFGGMLALIYAHTYPEHTEAVIYDCPMWSALHTARAIALAVKPLVEEKQLSKQLETVRGILREDVQPRDAFNKAFGMEWEEGMDRYCHVIEMERYNAYLNEHISDPGVTADCWGRYVLFRKKIIDAEDFYGDYLHFIDEIDKPQFLLVGEYDMTCGKYEQEYFTAHAPKGSLHILADSAHLSWFEHPEEYTELIKDFVYSVSF